MEWDNLTRMIGVIGMFLSYYVYTMHGSSLDVFVFVILSIGTLVAPEFVDNLPVGPNKSK